ncbi:hypothetical protein ONZ45_g12447 [Pleurotus djamor]|nr:hypothetical protein ONZ45_g12447 [Pleurotus djamor]
MRSVRGSITYLQGTISIEMVVNEIIKTTQIAELERNLSSIKTVDAGYRAPVNGRKSKWLEGTRTELLKDIEDWSMGGGKGGAQANARIFVLVGAAGTGKSTIAVQVAKILDKAGALGGSFFFERGIEELSATRHVFPTLAVQLARYHQPLAPLIAEAISTHRKDGNTQHLSYALDELIVEPLRLVSEDQWPRRPIVFVLDALDECNEQDQVPELLYLLLKRMRSLRFPLRLFLTTRPEYHIQDAFASVEWQSEPEPFQLHHIPTPILRGDIKLFIESRLGELGIMKTMMAIQSDAIERLTDAADGLFIYASTCLEFLHQYRRDLRRTLGLILDHGLNVNALDVLYKIVLVNAFSDDMMRALAALRDQLTPVSLCELLELRFTTLEEILERLRSVLTFDTNQPIRLLHASFPQFLADSTSKTVSTTEIMELLKEFTETQMLNWMEALAMMSRIEEAVTLLNLALDWYKGDDKMHMLLQDGYRFVSSFMDCIKECPFWIHTSALEFTPSTCLLREVYPYQDSDPPTVNILAGRDETWGPCLRMMRHDFPRVTFSPNGRWIASAGGDEHIKIWDSNNGALLRKLSDHDDWVSAHQFLSDDRIISVSPNKALKIWNVMTGACLKTTDLPWDVNKLAVSRTSNVFPQRVAMILPYTATQILDLDGQTLQSWSHSSHDLDWSADGRYLAVVVEHRIIIYDTISGSIWKELAVHGASNHSPSSHNTTVKFLPRAQRPDLLVSNSIDSNNVHLWHVDTRQCLHIFNGHTASITTLAVNPSCTIIASGSDDHTIRLWSIQDKSCLAIFNGNDNLVSLAFSPDGRMLGSGNSHGDVQLWDVSQHPAPLHQASGIEPSHLSKSLRTWIFQDSQLLVTRPQRVAPLSIWSLSDDRLLATVNCEGPNLILQGIACSSGWTWIALVYRHRRSRAKDDTLTREQLFYGTNMSLVNTITQETSSLSLSHLGIPESDEGVNKEWLDTLSLQWDLSVSPDGRTIYLGIGCPRRYYIVEWELKTIKSVPGNEVLPSVLDKSPHPSYNFKGLWLGDRLRRFYAVQIPSTYHGECRTIQYDGYGAQLVVIRPGGVVALELRFWKLEALSLHHKEGWNTQWQMPYRCMMRAAGFPVAP